MTGKVLFMIRRVYFDQIVDGTKSIEWRGVQRWQWLRTKKPEQAVFMCGRRIHRRKISIIVRRRIENLPDDLAAILRDLYPDEKEVFGIHLGDVID